MNVHAAMLRPHRWPALAAALALLATLSLGPAASAQQSTDVSVTAEVTGFTPILTLTICDTTADFGTGLTATGSVPTRSNTDGDAVAATSQGSNPGEGVFYSWNPSCQAQGTGHFITVVSNGSWSVGYCATDNTGTNPDLTTVDDLRFGFPSPTTYADATNGTAFPDCAHPSGFGASGNQAYDRFYFLRVDDMDEGGTFAATTTWSLTPA